MPVSGKVLDPDDFAALVDASPGRMADGRSLHGAVPAGARSLCGSPVKSVFVNSGSSANLAALSALTSPKLGKRALKEGDEVLTVAMGFPTTVNPIIQNRLAPWSWMSS